MWKFMLGKQKFCILKKIAKMTDGETIIQDTKVSWQDTKV